MGARLTLASPPRGRQSRRAVVVILWSGVWMPPLPRAGTARPRGLPGYFGKGAWGGGGCGGCGSGSVWKQLRERERKERRGRGSTQGRRRDRPGSSPLGSGGRRPGRRHRPLPADSSAQPAADPLAPGSGRSYGGGSGGPGLRWRRPPWRSSNSVTR